MGALTAVIGVTLLLAPAKAVAGEPAPGETVTLACRVDPAQRYACYLPRAYDPAKRWPVLFCFAPDGQGDLLAGMFREAAEEHGWIVLGSLNVKAGDRAPNLTAIDTLWADSESRLSLSASMRFAGGFSAGARISFLLAERQTAVQGVIAIGAGLPKDRGLPARKLAVFAACGETDFNKGEMDRLAADLEKAGHPASYENFPGGHAMPGKDILARAVAWLDDRAPERRAARLREGLDGAVALAEEGRTVDAYRKLLDLLEEHAGVEEHRDAAAALRKRLEKEPAVKPEAAAEKKLQAALAWIEKSRDRIESSGSVRSQAVRRLREVEKRYPDTRAAARAKRRAEEIESGGR